MLSVTSSLRVFIGILVLLPPTLAFAQPTNPRKQEKETLTYPPELPGGKRVVTFNSPDLLRKPETIHSDVEVAKTPPTIDLLYYPGQNYPGNPWSVWGDGSAAPGRYYSAIGDHLAPQGNAFVYEYDAESKEFRLLCDVQKLIDLPEGHYTPGKVHTRVDVGSDGRVYFATHRGSTRVTTDEYHFRGDWVIAADPKSGKAEVLIHAPVAKHCIPTGALDPKRLIFYGGTTAGEPIGGDENIQFFAYDIGAGKVIYTGPRGPSRYLMVSTSTGRVYYTPSTEGKTLGQLVRFDPAHPNAPQPIDAYLGLRAATDETPQGIIYTVSQSDGDQPARFYAFDVTTEMVRKLGPAAVGTQQYITSIDADPTGRYLYYVPGAHGGSENDGCPIVQFDTQTGRKKVLAFLHPYCREKFGFTL